MESKVYNQAGEVVGSVKLPKAVFGVSWNPDLVHQVMVGMQEGKRLSLAHVKDRGEVSGGGKKPWRQKGTGRARHGSTRSPIWRKGGVTHGPVAERVYGQKINKKMKIQALYTALSAKYRDGELIFLDRLDIDQPKTKLAMAMLTNLATATKAPALLYARGRRALIAGLHSSEAVMKSFRNIKSVSIDEVRNLNPLDVLTYQYLVLTDPEASVASLAGRAMSSKSK
ncbi:MAG: 50S ribosomal protein L4 [Candidatus Vogelbacteria bacterium]